MGGPGVVREGVVRGRQLDHRLLHGQDAVVLHNAAPTVIAIWHKRIRQALHHLPHQCSALGYTLCGEFTITLMGILSQQVETALHVTSQACEFAETVCLGKDRARSHVGSRILEIVRAGATVVVDVKRHLAWRGRRVLDLLLDRKGIVQASRTVHVSRQFLAHHLGPRRQSRQHQQTGGDRCLHPNSSFK